MTYYIIDTRDDEVVDVAPTPEEAADVCDEWNEDHADRPYKWVAIREDGDRPVPNATA